MWAAGMPELRAPERARVYFTLINGLNFPVRLRKFFSAMAIFASAVWGKYG